MQVVTLAFVGDIAFFPRSFNEQRLIFNSRQTAEIVKADIKVANFEFPFSKERIPFFECSHIGYLAPFESIEILGNLKFDMFSLANNHIMDWGLEGLLNTKKYLAEAKTQTFVQVEILKKPRDQLL